MTTTQADVAALSRITALLDTRIEACRAKDIDRLMTLYAADAVYFDVIPPLQFTGVDEIRRNFLRWFAEYDGPIGLETSNQNVAVSGDIAFAHMLHLDRGNRWNKVNAEFWLRSTVCLQRISGTWLITHEHISLPIDWGKSGMVALDLKP